MHKRMLAVLATLALLLIGTVGIAAAKDGEGGGTDRCETSGGKAEGCENHPGNHEGDDDDDGSGSEPSCADLGAIDQALVDACNSILNPEPGPDPEPPSVPSCADLGAIDQALVDACNSVVDQLP